MNQQPLSETAITQSSDAPPRVNLNNKVKESISESTNMSQDTEDDTEDDTYSFENEEMTSLMLESKMDDSEGHYAYSNYRHTSFDGLREDQTGIGHYHSLSLDDVNSLSAQEALYTASVFATRAKKTRRSSSQADSILHALTPPSHALKARRFSKNNHTETSTTAAPVEMSRQHSLVSECQKELSNHSAVSPRFMSLRKLSEVTNLPNYGLSYTNSQDVPPVPKIPSAHITPSSSPPLASIAPPSPPSTNSPIQEKEESDLLSDMVQAQLQYHLGQMSWRVSESQAETQRFWEEQKSQVFGFAQTMVERIEQEMRQKLASLVDATADLSALKQELVWHQQQAQCQSQELETLRIRNVELEKQHEIDVAIIKSQQIDKEKVEARLQQYEESSEVQKKHQIKLLDLKTQNKQLKAHVARVEQTNRKLNDQLAECQKELETKNRQVKRKSSGGKEEITWAEIMESEDEAKKNVELWAKKYKELEQTHQEVCLRFEQEQIIFENFRTECEQEMRQLKQVDSINRVQLDYLQSELKKAQKSIKHCACCKYQIQASSRAPKRAQSFIAKDGYLTFTAEINGQLSRYSVKIPQEQVPKHTLNPNAPSWTQP
ncbi:hypothetical protein G6F46_004051 [Rhizopus delemar]|uniref:Uncharacterized protein n=2 Tax=Rhizopus TaxID=4842 RepID=A0A9P7CLN4_9FUNG|nr:hypothetical protein G6F43_005591 [Rhizopus delemar]KAG1545491.1 hypothetical protein G6F51_005434 [Rhizopus arrhizus]KAG1456248.1 hypothetical protein G6F55_006609 [Rhizopus delemar]KAG1497830.1 hypothetical protein G6F54_005500 [Rhizopus delemar]KAG1509417.1 hypothetical protein G6F53_007462 [Rhizopus delemar]